MQADGRAGCAVFSPNTEPPEEGWVGRRLPAHSSSTFSELHGVLDAVSLLCQRSLNGVVICDSQATLHTLTSASRVCRHLVNRILTDLTLAHDRSLVIKFVWIPSHVSSSHSDALDRLAKAVCGLPAPDAGPAPRPLPSNASRPGSEQLLYFPRPSERTTREWPASPFSTMTPFVTIVSSTTVGDCWFEKTT